MQAPKKKLLFSFAFSLIFTSSIAISASAETLIVAAKNSSITAITNKVAAKLWMGKKKRLNGKKVIIIDQQEDTPAQIEFYQKLLKKSTSEMKAYWAKLVFMGNSFPPRKLADDNKVKHWLSKHPASIGYIDVSSKDDSVKVLLTIK
ncbi:MAG: hypothetical protein JKX78_12490 [Alteromonadaceae bacterium]|nr:hypothetical protein [Alteromonadaceae bacterium]